MEFYFSLELDTDERCNLLPHVITSELRTIPSQACSIRKTCVVVVVIFEGARLTVRSSRWRSLTGTDAIKTDLDIDEAEQNKECSK